MSGCFTLPLFHTSRHMVSVCWGHTVEVSGAPASLSLFLLEGRRTRKESHRSVSPNSFLLHLPGILVARTHNKNMLLEARLHRGEARDLLQREKDRLDGFMWLDDFDSSTKEHGFSFF